MILTKRGKILNQVKIDKVKNTMDRVAMTLNLPELSTKHCKLNKVAYTMFFSFYNSV